MQLKTGAPSFLVNTNRMLPVMIHFLPPCIDANAFPMSERTDIHSTRRNLFALANIARNLIAAVELRKFSQSQHQKVTLENFRSHIHDHNSRMLSWGEMAGRMSCIYVYEFSTVMHETNKMANLSQSMRAHVNKSLLSEAFKNFEISFPSFGGLRQAAAHGHEFLNNSKKIEKHSLEVEDSIGDFLKVDAGAKAKVTIQSSYHGEEFI